MRGEGLGFPLQRHRHLLPAQPPPPLPGLPGHKTQTLLCVWVSVGCPQTPWGWHCTASFPRPPSPASCALELAAQMWPDSTAGAKAGVQQLGHICPGAALGEASPACRAPMHPHFPAQFQHQGRHMKDVPLGKSCGRRGSVLPVPSLRLWSITSLSSLITKIPWDLTCTLPSIPTAVGAGI